MTAIERVERTRRTLSTTVLLRSALWVVAVALALFALLAGLDALAGLPRLLRALALPGAIVLALAAGARAAWLGRFARSSERVSLWIEERVPQLRYALATLADPRLPPSAGAGELERIVAAADWSEPLRRGVVRALVPPAALAVAGALALLVLPPSAVARIATPRPGDVLAAVAGNRSRGSVLSPLAATVTPPAYTGRRPVVLEEPASVGGIAGSDVVVAGRGRASRVKATLGADTVVVEAAGSGWQARFRMPDDARALRLTDGASERLVTIEPYPDSVPVVSLKLPLRDTVYRTTDGSLTLSADFRDDLGLSAAWFEYIVTSGEMESFHFRTGVLQRTTLTNRADTSLRLTVSLGALQLGAGDVVHLRAVATDGNTLSGPGRGTSETRTIRVARRGEFDSLAVEAMPANMGDTAALSQRMLIMLAEALQRRRPGLARDTLVTESRGIARDQARLRRRVADIIFARVSGESSGEESEGDQGRPTTPEEVLAAAESAAAGANDTAALDFGQDESPVIAINRPLLEAYNAMWDAGRELEIGEPDDALPFMRAALAAIQRARQAERLYLRGRPPTVVIDLRSARLAGDRAGAASARRVAGPPSGAEAARLAARLAVVFGVARRDPLAAADSLLLLRLAALGRYPAFAAAVGQAATQLRAGVPAGAAARERSAATVLSAFVRARDALSGEPRHDGALGAWEASP